MGGTSVIAGAITRADVEDLMMMHFAIDFEKIGKKNELNGRAVLLN